MLMEVHTHIGDTHSVFLINLFPFFKRQYNIGQKIAEDYMKMPPKKY